MLHGTGGGRLIFFRLVSTRTLKKAELRRRFRAKRSALSAPEHARAARNLAVMVAGTRLFCVSRRIASYFPNDGEIDATAILARIWSLGKFAYLPVLSRGAQSRMRFAPTRPGMRYKPNRLGIPEPVVSDRELVDARNLDLILMPLVAFDTAGNRLGMGAGYYDRTLDFLRRNQHWHRPRLLGLAHDFQRVESLESDPWDVPLSGVVTDHAIYFHSSNELISDRPRATTSMYIADC